MRCARPSATAVFPTPGGPTRQALFFLRLSRICTVRCISASRPTTGSRSPSLAICVRLEATVSSVGRLLPPPPPTAASSRAGGACGGRPISAWTAVHSCSLPRPSSLRTLAAPQPVSPGWPMARSSCSLPTSPCLASVLARSKSCFAFWLKGSEPEPALFAPPREAARSATAALMASRVTPFCTRAALATRLLSPFCSSATMPRRTSSVHTSPYPCRIASSCAQ
mmetsp:Transcript_70392/g.227902  ORF Transcript_70392/g.227902 Transcript_70392/m.227902 type:complete len:224 (-) Transcript_70392:360-1031(-)